MVAVAQFIPNDPEEKESVLAVLRDHPGLQELIARTSEKARASFTDVRISLDTMRCDDGDPPVRMLIQVTQPWADYTASSGALFTGSPMNPAIILSLSALCRCGMARSKRIVHEGP